MHLYLARHGESISNVKWPDYDSPDESNGELTENGVRQAEALADWMDGNIPQIDAVYTSSLRRTAQTAHILAQKYGMESKAVDDLREAGFSYLDHSPIPDDLLPVFEYEEGFHQKPFVPFAEEPARVESIAHMRARAGRFIDGLLARHRGERVLVVMHGGMLNAIMDNIFNIGPYRRCNAWIEYTAFSHFEYTGDPTWGPWRVFYLAQSEHLALAGLPKNLEA